MHPPTAKYRQLLILDLLSNWQTVNSCKFCCDGLHRTLMRHGGVDETTIKLFATYLTSGESLMGFSLQVKFTRNLIKCQLYALKDKIVLLYTIHKERMVVNCPVMYKQRRIVLTLAQEKFKSNLFCLSFRFCSTIHLWHLLKAFGKFQKKWSINVPFLLNLTYCVSNPPFSILSHIHYLW